MVKAPEKVSTSVSTPLFHTPPKPKPFDSGPPAKESTITTTAISALQASSVNKASRVLFPELDDVPTPSLISQSSEEIRKKIEALEANLKAAQTQFSSERKRIHYWYPLSEMGSELLELENRQNSQLEEFNKKRNELLAELGAIQKKSGSSADCESTLT